MSDSPVTLADITVTSRLWSRPFRGPDARTFATIMQHLGETITENPRAVFEECAEMALVLCRAHSAGVSLCERTPDGDDILHWISLVGRLKDQLPKTSPRYQSPAGACVDMGSPLLVERPERIFSFLNVGIPMHEVLHVPIGHAGDKLRGTLCVMSHAIDHVFDAEDARVLQHLGIFVTTALKMTVRLEKAEHDAQLNAIAFRELNHRIKNTLQLTSDILRLQANGIGDLSARSLLAAACDRLMTMGHVHNIQSGDEECELGRVLQEVCGSMNGTDLHYSLAFDVPDSVRISAQRAAIVALIANELVTNAIKHAFKPGSRGAIKVVLVRTGPNEAELTVTDDGPVLSGETALQEGTGLRLLRLLVAQLGGLLEIELAAKRFCVTFPLIS